MPHPFSLTKLIVAFVAAPLLFTAATWWISVVFYFALVFGGPLYLVIGLPVLIRHLRRHPARYVPVMLLAMISVAGAVPAGIVLAWWTGEWELLEALPAYMTLGLVFAAIWSAVFTALYRWLLRR